MNYYKKRKQGLNKMKR